MVNLSIIHARPAAIRLPALAYWELVGDGVAVIIVGLVDTGDLLGDGIPVAPNSFRRVNSV